MLETVLSCFKRVGLILLEAAPFLLGEDSLTTASTFFKADLLGVILLDASLSLSNLLGDSTFLVGLGLVGVTLLAAIFWENIPHVDALSFESFGSGFVSVTASGNCSVSFSDDVGCVAVASVLLPPCFLLGDEGPGRISKNGRPHHNLFQRSKIKTWCESTHSSSRFMGGNVLQHKSFIPNQQSPRAPDRDLKCWASIFKRSRSVLNVANISAFVGVGPFSTAFSVAFSQTSCGEPPKSPGNDHKSCVNFKTTKVHDSFFFQLSPTLILSLKTHPHIISLLLLTMDLLKHYIKQISSHSCL